MNLGLNASKCKMQRKTSAVDTDVLGYVFKKTNPFIIQGNFTESQILSLQERPDHTVTHILTWKLPSTISLIRCQLRSSSGEA